MWHVSDLYLKSVVNRVKINGENCLLQCSDVAHQYPESAASQLNKMLPSYQLVMYPGAEGGYTPIFTSVAFRIWGWMVLIFEKSKNNPYIAASFILK